MEAMEAIRTILTSVQISYISDTNVNREIRHSGTHCPDKMFATSASDTFC